MHQTVHFGEWQGSLGKGLAERELYCLMAVASGHTDKEIAKIDGLSPRSIKGRIEAAMFKLGVFKRSAMVAEALKRGLISPAAVMAIILAVHASMAEDPALRVRRGSGERRIETRVAVRRIEVALTA